MDTKTSRYNDKPIYCQESVKKNCKAKVFIGVGVGVKHAHKINNGIAEPLH